ncbi:hypothetical protein [Desulfurispora thermophila]|uniref:hypothetical protein n=1 Tax=Desulfurispora thermophila TaxID=265470 RepID=UPI000369AC20|nr:hypothetical protein [Desulfurispora thermophila]
MQLPPGQRAILAYFATSDDARRAAGELAAAGYSVTDIDRISRFGTNIDQEYNNPINRAITSTGPVLYNDSTGNNLTDSERVLLAADPSVSGFANKDYGIAGGSSFLLTLVTEESKVRQAEEIINKHGGHI